MSEIGDVFKALKAVDMQERDENRVDASVEFPDAAAFARRHGMRLVKHSEVHYQLIDGWIMNIYPGNQRLFADKNRRAPFLKVPSPWSLMDVVLPALGTKGE